MIGRRNTRPLDGGAAAQAGIASIRALTHDGSPDVHVPTSSWTLEELCMRNNAAKSQAQQNNENVSVHLLNRYFKLVSLGTAAKFSALCNNTIHVQSMSWTITFGTYSNILETRGAARYASRTLPPSLPSFQKQLALKQSGNIWRESNLRSV